MTATTDIFTALQTALAGECADPYETAQRLEQRLHKAGYAILPVPHGYHFADRAPGAEFDLRLTGLNYDRTKDAMRALERMLSARPKVT
jgi:hypothetical protein